MAKPVVEFWFDFASTYSYLAAMRIDALASKADIDVVWTPFLLGPIFKSQGWNTSPFNLYRAKGAYMWRDMARFCAAMKVPFRKPDEFPQNSLLPARVATAAVDQPWVAQFCRNIFTLEFGQGRVISEEATVAQALEGLDEFPDRWITLTQDTAVKTALRERTQRAVALGIFGAPSFVAAGELFWGNDRLEHAIAWARGDVRDNV